MLKFIGARFAIFDFDWREGSFAQPFPATNHSQSEFFDLDDIDANAQNHATLSYKQ